MNEYIEIISAFYVYDSFKVRKPDKDLTELKNYILNDCYKYVSKFKNHLNFNKVAEVENIQNNLETKL